MLSKQSVFDSTTVANGDSIAAYVFGTARVASAAVGGNESLYTIAALHDGSGNSLSSAGGSLNVAVTAFSATVGVVGTVADNAADSGDPVKVGYRATQAFPAAVDDGDRADALSDLQRRLRVTTAPNIAALVTRADVGNTAAVLLASELTGRQKMTIQNRGGKKVWIGFDSTVTADDAATGGIVLDAHNGTWSQDLGDNVSLYAISDTAGQHVFVYEAA